MLSNYLHNSIAAAAKAARAAPAWDCRFAAPSSWPTAVKLMQLSGPAAAHVSHSLCRPLDERTGGVLPSSTVETQLGQKQPGSRLSAKHVLKVGISRLAACRIDVLHERKNGERAETHADCDGFCRAEGSRCRLSRPASRTFA